MVLSQIEQYILDNDLPDITNRIVIGVSGGADSVALLDILTRLGYECIVAHCNFHLRAEDSNRDAAFVRELCSKYGLKSHFIDFDTEVFAKENSISIEMAARKLRYDWFEEIRVATNSTHIAVAHHRDDSVETILLNLVRGTGIRGLKGISPKNGFVIRPLLVIGRVDILDYIQSRKLEFVEDYTNNEDVYTRNFIRLNVIPLLETINPSVKESIIRTSEHLVQVENIYANYIEIAKQKIVDGNKINIAKLLDQIEPKAVLYELLSPYMFNSAAVDSIFNSLNGQSGKIFLSETHKIVKDRSFLFIEKIEKGNKSDESHLINIDEIGITQISNPIILSIQVIDKAPDFSFNKSRNILYLDYDKLILPLTLRHWRQGDWFIPFGMNGRKKISDYFSDNKFSLIEKENTWLLCTQKGDIVSIIGHRSGERFKIDNETKKMIIIKYNPE